jgi:8-oxo-dGTP pyrophosphatase MutT (NUDIX family)
MSHIHTEPNQHDLTVGALIIKTDGHEPTVLLHRHKKLGIYLQFGGHVELHETPWQAIVREIKEEAGYDISQLQLLQPELRLQAMQRLILHPQPMAVHSHQYGELDHFHSELVYAFVTDQAPTHTSGKGESKELMAFTVKQLSDLGSDDIHEDTCTMCSYAMDQLYHQWQLVDPRQFEL